MPNQSRRKRAQCIFPLELAVAPANLGSACDPRLLHRCPTHMPIRPAGERANVFQRQPNLAARDE